MTGLEPECLQKGELDQLETCFLRFMRKLLGPEGSYTYIDPNGNSTKRQYSNQWIHTHLNIATIHSTLRHRRLRWLKQIIFDPGNNRQLIAAMFGHLHNEDPMDPIKTNPWLDQWLQDLQTFSDQTQAGIDVTQRYHAEGIDFLLNPAQMRWFLDQETYVIL